MSKKRPRARKATRLTRKRLDRDDPAYWSSRIFKGTYTYNGQTRETSKWYVKFQISGTRRTIPLNSSDANIAALEACRAYRIAIEDRNESGPQPPSERDARNIVRMSEKHWKSRLLRRSYIEFHQREVETEWSIVIDHDHVRKLFPLGTMDVDEAATRAAERFRTVAQEGWRMADLQYEQEFTIAIFWKLNPIICTYSTMLTIPVKVAADIPQGGPACAVVVETDEGVGRALRRWLTDQSARSFRVVTCTPEKLKQVARREHPSIIMVNLSVDQKSISKTIERLAVTSPDLPIFTYGVYEDSDGIFASLSGVSGGYVLRRRPPNRILDPLAAYRSKALTVARSQRMIQRYFQRLIDGAEGTPRVTTEQMLTIREHEVMVFMAQGLQDKEIASKLDISTWTVNSHVRHIYRKFDVHGRTEAVVKFLEMDSAL